MFALLREGKLRIYYKTPKDTPTIYTFLVQRTLLDGQPDWPYVIGVGLRAYNTRMNDEAAS